MSIRSTLFIFTLLVLLLPLGVALTSWRGLERMDAEINRISEEYEEAQILAQADSDISVAVLMLRGHEVASEDALKRLASAESALLDFLTSQARTASSETHQSEELQAAQRVLAELRALLESQGNELDRAARLEKTIGVEATVRSLRAEADRSVDEAQASARDVERSTLRLVLVGSLGATLICTVVAIWANRGVMKRLRELHRAVSARAESGRPMRRSDLGGVVREIDELSERMYRSLQEKNRELLRRERVAGIGLLAADVAHELRNPLNAMLGLTELSLRATEAGTLDGARCAEVRESLVVVRREAVRCRDIVERLMAMVRARSKPTRFDCAALLSETVQVARAARPDKASCFHLMREGQPLWAISSSQEVRQIILTLLINAADAIAADGRIEVDATASDSEVWLRIRDDGKGFDASQRLEKAVAFETTRAEEGGTGLGLSIAQSLAADIGAEIRCYSDGPGKGSLFLLAIPLHEEPR